MKKLLFSLLALVLCVGTVTAQETVGGTVSDGSGDPLIGATIYFKGTSVGTTSDHEGNYSISIPNGASILVFSAAGYATKEVNLTGNGVENVVLAAAQ